ncbi:uncharacterized protein K02A2.6-like [Rhipicephalus sanguineus]|uniref:uncharacterized protein K02A2.6-like n=1 Tax=Rhipicephalus sanguineus TaxID=34632 RepID=UPI0018936AFC|nr:uncharacterized protein K02A2.6-like [Rhipicephalus sanguineus]
MHGVNNLTGTTMEDILAKFSGVFDGELTGHSGPPVRIDLAGDVTPKFLKCRQVPFALRDAVCRELDKLQAQGLIESIAASDWAMPVVVVRKKNGSLRFCGDYRSTVNASIKPTAYPLPTAAELLATLRGGQIFSKVDLT